MFNETEQRVCQRIITLEDELIRVLSKLVSFNTADPPGDNYDECAGFLRNYLAEIGAHVEIVQVPEESLPRDPVTGKPLSRPNVIAEIAGSGGGAVLHFNGHYDVVPAVGEWTTDPYKPVIKNGRLYGRGSSDMKAGIAATILAAKALKLEGVNLKGTISFSFVPDEEYGQPNGARFLVEQGKVQADYCIVAEPSGGINLFNGFKGSLWMEISTCGKPAHGSSPWKGINAFDKMVKVAQEIERKIKPGLLHQEDTEVNKSQEITTGAITVGGRITTGESPNIVPHQCTLTVDRRLVPGEDVQEVVDGFSSILKSLKREDPNFNGELKVLIGYNAGSTPLDSPLISTLKQTMMDVAGRAPDISLLAGGDVRYFHEAGIPIALYGPGDMAMAHKVDEYAEIETLVTAAQIYAVAAMRLCHTHLS